MDKDTRQILPSRRSRWSSVSLVVAALLLALVAVMAIPVLHHAAGPSVLGAFHLEEE